MLLQILTSRSSYIQKNAQLIKKSFNKKFKVQIINNSNKIKKNSFIVVVISYYKLIKNENLRLNKNIFVIHESNLPQGRGMSPLFNQILDGKEKITTSVFKCNKIIDDGPIVLKKNFYFPKNLIYDEIKHKQMKNSIFLTKKLINLIKTKKIKLIKQTGRPTYFKKISTSVNKLNLNKSIKSQIDIIRTRDSKDFKGYFFYKKRKFFLHLVPEKKY